MRINVLLNLLLVTGFQTASLPALAQTSDAIDLLIERIEQAEAAGRNYHRDRLIEQIQRTSPNHPRAIEFRLNDA